MSDATGAMRRADNKVVQGGHPYFETVRVGGTAAILPGVLVKRDTTSGTTDDQHFQPTTTGDGAITWGVLDVIFSEFVAGTRGGQVVGTTIPVGDAGRVARGIFLARALIQAGATAITKGDALTCDTSGTVKKAGSGDYIVGYAAETLDNSGGSATVGLLISFNKGGKF